MISRQRKGRNDETKMATQDEGGAHPHGDAPAALDLLPGVRQRLNQRLEHFGIPQRGRLTYVAALTYRAVQTVSRWFESERPGLPDVESLARLCDGLGCSSDWVLGLTPEMGGNPALLHASATESMRWKSTAASWCAGSRIAWVPGSSSNATTRLMTTIRLPTWMPSNVLGCVSWARSKPPSVSRCSGTVESPAGKTHPGQLSTNLWIRPLPPALSTHGPTTRSAGRPRPRTPSRGHSRRLPDCSASRH